MSKVLHMVAMGTIFVGGIILLYFAYYWFVRGNGIMGTGMFLMGVVALSNFYLHRMAMLKDRGSK